VHEPREATAARHRRRELGDPQDAHEVHRLGFVEREVPVRGRRRVDDLVALRDNLRAVLRGQAEAGPREFPRDPPHAPLGVRRRLEIIHEELEQDLATAALGLGRVRSAHQRIDAALAPALQQSPQNLRTDEAGGPRQERGGHA